MENLFIQQTKTTPLVSINDTHLEISGRSMPENPVEFYKPLFDALCNKKNLSIFDINLEYFNSTSAKCLLNLISYVGKKFDKVIISWYHDIDDDEMIDFVDEIMTLSGVKIKLIETSENN